jgi:hypothetical protein
VGGCPEATLAPGDVTELQLTAMEDPMAEVLRGPDASWLKDEGAQAPRRTYEGVAVGPEPAKREAKMKQLEEAGRFAIVAEASNHLQSYVRARVLNGELGGSPCDVLEALEQASARGNADLADEAQQVLEDLGKVGDAGGHQTLRVSGVTWNGPAPAPGCGEATILGEVWPYVDWRDRFVPPSDLAAALGLEEGEFEERQCLCLNVAGGVLQAKQGSQPPVDEVLALAGDMRSDQWDRAQQAQAALGDAPPWVHSVEAELRRDCHDSGHKHHEKGYRSLRFFPPGISAGLCHPGDTAGT